MHRSIRRMIFQIITTISIFIGFLPAAYSQVNEVKAKIKYQKAELALDKANYQEALNSLHLAEQFLEKWTPKVSFLKIKALNELALKFAYTDTAIVNSLKKEVAEYIRYAENNPGSIIEEKFSYVYNLVPKLNNLEEHTSGQIANLNDAVKKLNSAASQGIALSKTRDMVLKKYHIAEYYSTKFKNFSVAQEKTGEYWLKYATEGYMKKWTEKADGQIVEGPKTEMFHSAQVMLPLNEIAGFEIGEPYIESPRLLRFLIKLKSKSGRDNEQEVDKVLILFPNTTSRFLLDEIEKGLSLFINRD